MSFASGTTRASNPESAGEGKKTERSWRNWTDAGTAERLRDAEEEAEEVDEKTDERVEAAKASDSLEEEAEGIDEKTDERVESSA